ncbi:uncharacterized protein LOC119519629 [Choloepus didactylus]|uniref:uncharacterized protein LOC119519629 n=1 Tax=Choloepus didactylus TaxID=27675 RepID=UPI00189F5472|nr:uncharacterized protein LOC119519629 [Choloepus didactylus]
MDHTVLKPRGPLWASPGSGKLLAIEFCWREAALLQETGGKGRDSGDPWTCTRHPTFPLLPGETRFLPSTAESSMIHRHLWTHNRGPWGDQPPAQPLTQPPSFQLPWIHQQWWENTHRSSEDSLCAPRQSILCTLKTPTHRQLQTNNRQGLDHTLPVEPVYQPHNFKPPPIILKTWTDDQCPLGDFHCAQVFSQLNTFDPPPIHRQPRTRTRQRLDALPPEEPLVQASIPTMSEDLLSKPAIIKTPQVKWQLPTCISHPVGNLLPLDPLTQVSAFQPLIIHHPARISTQCPFYHFLWSEPLSQPSVTELQQIHQQPLFHTQFPLDPLLLPEPLSQESFVPAEIHWQPETCDRCPMELLPPLEPSSQSSILLPLLFQWKMDTQISGDTCLLKNPGEGDLVNIDGLGTRFEALAVARSVHSAVLPLSHPAQGMAFPWPEDLGLGTESKLLSLRWTFCGAILFIGVLLSKAWKGWRGHEHQMDLELREICKTRKLVGKSLLDCEEALDHLELNARVTISVIANLLEEVSELNDALRVCELEHLRI